MKSGIMSITVEINIRILAELPRSNNQQTLFDDNLLNFVSESFNKFVLKPTHFEKLKAAGNRYVPVLVASAHTIVPTAKLHAPKHLERPFGVY